MDEPFWVRVRTIFTNPGADPLTDADTRLAFEPPWSWTLIDELREPLGWKPLNCHPPWFPHSSTVIEVEVKDVSMNTGVVVSLVNLKSIDL
jgi:hypothetical protein